LLLDLNTSIKTTISSDGHTLIAENVTEADLPNFPLITNFPDSNAILKFVGIQVFLDGSDSPTAVYGLNDIFSKKILKENSLAFRDSKRTYLPFKIWGPKAANVNVLIDNLSEISSVSQDTKDHVKTYKLAFSNAESAESPLAAFIATRSL